MPEGMIGAVNSWKESNPDYRYQFFDDDELENYIYCYDCTDFSFNQRKLRYVFNRINPPAAKADLFRYLLLYERGGFYADIDSFCRASLSDWIGEDSDVVMGFEPLGDFHGFIQWAMAYAPQHPFMRATIERTVSNIYHEKFDFDFKHVFCLTGPITMTSAIHEVMDLPQDFLAHEAGDRLTENGKISLFDRNQFRRNVNSRYATYGQERSELGIKQTYHLPIFTEVPEQLRPAETLLGPVVFDGLKPELQKQFLQDHADPVVFWDWFVDESATRSMYNVPADLRPFVRFEIQTDGHASVVWNPAGFEARMYRTRERLTDLPSPPAYPGATDQIYRLLDQFDFGGRSVAVVGSISPWIEAMFAAEGADVTSVEYADVSCLHSRVRCLKHDEFVRQPDKFDVIISYSSIEHDGLGRYGDPIDPNGDLLAMMEFRYCLKSDGVLFLAVPMHQHDVIRYNTDRLYGPMRFKRLIDGWQIIGQTPVDAHKVFEDIEQYWQSWNEAFSGKQSGQTFVSERDTNLHHARGEHPIWHLRSAK